jgi:competence protein ComEA
MRFRILLIPGWRRWLLVALPPLALVGVAAGAAVYMARPATAPPPAPAARVPELPPAPGLLVDVSGAVAHPGLYRLSRGDRIYAAVAAAGGLTADADPDRMPNLAGRLRDGEHIRVPRLKGAAAVPASTSKVSLNTATVEQLAAVPGFTPDLAAAVVNHRETYGGFRSTRELVTALGMGQAEYAAARSHLTI